MADLSQSVERSILDGYCRELSLPVIGTHGLRHSTSELYQSGGATQDDLRQLFAHSSSEITDRYIHHNGNLDTVVRKLRVLSGGKNEEKTSQTIPISGRVSG